MGSLEDPGILDRQEDFTFKQFLYHQENPNYDVNVPYFDPYYAEMQLYNP